MEAINSVVTVATTIQLSVAPVFLLAGIAGIMNVLATRLGRIVDRARIMERQINGVAPAKRELVQEEITSLWQRIRVINWSIRLSVIGALEVCLVIMSLFIANIIELNLTRVIAALFISAMLMIIGALVLFLIEVGVSTKRMRQGLEIAAEFQKAED